MAQYENSSEFHETLNKYYRIIIGLPETLILLTVVHCQICILPITYYRQKGGF